MSLLIFVVIAGVNIWLSLVMVLVSNTQWFGIGGVNVTFAIMPMFINKQTENPLLNLSVAAARLVMPFGNAMP